MRDARNRVNFRGRSEKEKKKDEFKFDTSQRRKIRKITPYERARKDLLDAYFVSDHFTVLTDFSGLLAHSNNRIFPSFLRVKNFERDSNYL